MVNKKATGKKRKELQLHEIKAHRGQQWVFTWNNYTDEDEKTIKTLFEKGELGYVVYGREVSPTTGTKHLQGYLQTKGRPRGGALLNKLKGVSYIHPAYGNNKNNYSYCTKGVAGVEDGGPGANDLEGEAAREREETIVEMGEVKEMQQGKRTDLNTVRDEIMEGRTAEDILENDPEMYHKYRRTIHDLEDLYNRKRHRTWETEGLWIFGGTGVGKSHWVNEHYPDCYKVPNDRGWYDGYRGEEVVHLEEFTGRVAYCDLKDMVDKYKYAIPRRSREPVNFLAKLVIITGPMPPWEVYKNLNHSDKLDQLYRRFKVVEMRERGDWNELTREEIDKRAGPQYKGADIMTGVQLPPGWPPSFSGI